METTVLNVKINKQLKADAQAVAERLGIKLSTIINAELRKLVATKRVSYTAYPDPARAVAALKRVHRLGAPIRKRLGITTDADFVRLMKKVGIDYVE